MAKLSHEIRDPIHDFIRIKTPERRVLDSRPFQRLRHIHQLALTYMVYPGATHRRFEHSLGVMEVASRIFDVVTDREHLQPVIEELFAEQLHEYRGYWRRALRMAALCHDLGHLPFSHAPEGTLLPEGTSHEDLTVKIIRSEEMQEIWRELNLQTESIVKLAVGKEHAPELEFSDWESMLSEIIVHPAFGADRIDYLLRDSHHAGVAYGEFDHYRLIDTLRILPPAPSQPSEVTNGEEESGEEQERSIEPQLGVEAGGLRTAEALLWSRFFIWDQVYLHDIRRIYDHHLVEFLKEWLPGGLFSTELDEHLMVTDNDVVSAIWKAAHDPGREGHLPAKRLLERDHLKMVHQVRPQVVNGDLKAVPKLGKALAEEFGEGRVWADGYSKEADETDFPVLDPQSGESVSAVGQSDSIDHVPPVRTDRLYADAAIEEEARNWLRENKSEILR